MIGELGDRSPRQVGPYRILARLGAGGMGEVHLGADLRPGPGQAGGPGGGPRLAAVKTIRAELADDPAFRDRFRREIVTARSVDSRSTARLLAGDADAPVPWLATEYVAGPTLDRAVRVAGPLPLATVRGLGLRLARALRSIHHARVQHRDLKPANVLLGADGPKVIDFGIARAFGATTMTATGAMIGSPGYMSPEHVLGGQHVVASSDVFCLASVLCFAATGESPFGSGPVGAVLYRISQAEAELTDVPAELRELIEDCLSPDPSSRPDAAVLESRFRAAEEAAGAGTDGALVWPPEVAALITRYEDDLARTVASAGPLAGPVVPTMPGAAPVHSAQTVTGPPPPPATAPPAAPARRGFSRRTVAVVVAGALVVGVLGAVGLRSWQDSRENRNDAGATPPAAGPSPSRAPAPPAGVDQYGAERTRYFPADKAARPDGWQAWGTKMKGRPWSCALNSKALVCRTFHGGLEAVRASDGKPLWTAPSSSPGDRPIMTGTRGLALPGNPTHPVIHADTVVSAEGTVLRGRNVADGTVRWEKDLSTDPRQEDTGYAPDVFLGDGVAFFSTVSVGSQGVTAYDAATGKELWTRSLASAAGPRAADGMYAADSFVAGRLIARTEGGLTAFEARTGKPTYLSLPSGADCTAVREHDGRVLCDVEGDGTKVLDAKTLKQVPIAERKLGDAAAPARGAISTGSGQYRLGQGESSSEVTLTALGVPPSEGGPRSLGTPTGGSSEATIAGATAMFADNRYLYTLPVKGGERRRTGIEGAPGDGPADPADDAGDAGDFDDTAAQSWDPQLLSLGGVLFLAFHDGTLRSMEIPS
ncbi:protein kinase [Streptomyces sp. NPDC059452]|uniref:serine/threonine-protein kinase n=1 Tax=Streptomyces sp. NPDC059452 TaxID=3346835 RepID=UPI00367C6C6D